MQGQNNNQINNVHITYSKNIKCLQQYSKLLNLKIIHINAQSLVNKIDLLYAQIKKLNIEIGEVHVIVVSETWFTNLNVDVMNIPGYNSYHSLRKDKSGGGVSIYVLNSIKTNLLYEEHFDNNNVIVIKLSLQQK